MSEGMWHYAARRVPHPDGDYYEVVEVYRLHDGSIATTKNAVSPFGFSVKELAKELKMMREDVLAFDVEEPHEAD